MYIRTYYFIFFQFEDSLYNDKMDQLFLKFPRIKYNTMKIIKQRQKCKCDMVIQVYEVYK